MKPPCGLVQERHVDAVRQWLQRAATHRRVQSRPDDRPRPVRNDRDTPPLIHLPPNPPLPLPRLHPSPPNSNILIGWGHITAFTEFSPNGTVLCDTHISPVKLDAFGFSKNYRTLKYPWVGRPRTRLCGRDGVRCSLVGMVLPRWWRGGCRAEGTVRGRGFGSMGGWGGGVFETRLVVPRDAGEYVRAVAVDVRGEVLAYSPVVSRYEYTVVAPLAAPPRDHVHPFRVIFLAIVGAFVDVIATFYFRSALKRGLNRVFRGSASVKYHSLPTHA